MATSHEDPRADPTKDLISSASTGSVEYLNFVVELAPYIDIWQRMQDEHFATPEGFCGARMCAKGGTGIAFMVFPCVTRRLADLASRTHCRGALRRDL